jgi:hypothetical protein
LASPERRYGPAIEAHLQFLLWLIPAVEKFPRTQRFLLRDRIQTTALIDATYARDRTTALTPANLGIEKLRFFFRFSHGTLKYLDVRRYGYTMRPSPPQRTARAPLSSRPTNLPNVPTAARSGATPRKFPLATSMVGRLGERSLPQ